MKLLAFLLVLGSLGAAEHTLAPGVRLEEREFRRLDQGPFRSWILRIDAKQPALNVLPLHAGEKAVGWATTDEMAKRYGALAAVNGGYFAFGRYAGISKNNYVWNGRVWGTWKDRGSLVLCQETNGVERWRAGISRFAGGIEVGKEKWVLDGVNRERGTGELIWYTSDFAGSTRTSGGVEVELDANGIVRAIRKDGDSAMPTRGSILSADGRAAAWIQNAAVIGQKIKVTATVEQPLCAAQDLVSAGPLLVRDGKLDLSETGYAHAKARHPRTAAGVTRDGQLLLVVVDGRSSASVGMTIAELAEFLAELGAWEAVNLDGGGSSTLYAAGKIWNRPSDGRTRKVSDALLLFSLPDWPTVEEHLDLWSQDPNLLAKADAERWRQLGRRGEFKKILAEVERGRASEMVRRILKEALEALAYNRANGVSARPR
ncbi:MAG: phosphodiester glycosidase family protein [Bryobacter sp.]|nr:phosphodiester glycosidase family protein [Bryobacter sp.]